MRCDRALIVRGGVRGSCASNVVSYMVSENHNAILLDHPRNLRDDIVDPSDLVVQNHIQIDDHGARTQRVGYVRNAASPRGNPSGWQRRAGDAREDRRGVTVADGQRGDRRQRSIVGGVIVGARLLLRQTVRVGNGGEAGGCGILAAQYTVHNEERPTEHRVRSSTPDKDTAHKGQGREGGAL